MHLVVEHKTTSDDCGPGSTYWRKLALDGQCSTYLVGARSLGYDPQGILYDVLRKPALRPYEKNTKRVADETPQEYRARILADIAARPDYYYQRGTVVRLEEEERDAAFDMWTVGEAIREARRLERWPRNVDSCEQYHRLCDYFEVCSNERSIDDPLHFEHIATPHAELDGGKHHLPLLTTSSSRSFRACPRRYYYAYERAIRPRAHAGALRFGSLIHLGLEAWLTCPTRDDAALTAALAAVYTADRKAVDDYELAKIEAMLSGYHARWLAEPLDVLAVEKQFATPLINPESGRASRTWLLAGKVDAVVGKE